MPIQSETERVRSPQVSTNINTAEVGCIFQKNPSRAAKHVPHQATLTGATGDPIALKVINRAWESRRGTGLLGWAGTELDGLSRARSIVV